VDDPFGSEPTRDHDTEDDAQGICPQWEWTEVPHALGRAGNRGPYRRVQQLKLPYLSCFADTGGKRTGNILHRGDAVIEWAIL
jgi:hypothetical protein